MVGAPGMRAAILSTVARLDVGRVRFAAKLLIVARRQCYALFNSDGGEVMARPEKGFPVRQQMFLECSWENRTRLNGVLAPEAPQDSAARSL